MELFRTRWIIHLETLDDLRSLHRAAVKCMEMILNNSASWSAESVADAKSLLSAITSPEFLAALFIINQCLITLPILLAVRRVSLGTYIFCTLPYLI